LCGQTRAVPKIAYKLSNYSLDGEEIMIDYLLSVSTGLGKNDMLVITPRLVAIDGSNSHAFVPTLICGAIRGKVLKRSNELSASSEKLPLFIAENNLPNSIALTLTTNAESWMRNAKIIFEETLSGCADCVPVNNQRQYMLPQKEVYVPTYTLVYVMPEAELIKKGRKAMLQNSVMRSVNTISYRISPKTDK
jgi:hypothetical protein